MSSLVTIPSNGETIASLASSILLRTSLWWLMRSLAFSAFASAPGSLARAPESAICARVSVEASRVWSIANRPKLTSTIALTMIAVQRMAVSITADKIGIRMIAVRP